MSGGRDLSQPVILQSHIVSVRERKILVFSLKVNIFHEKSEKTPGFCSKQHPPSPGFRSLRSEGLATAYAVPFPSFSVSKAFMSETETVSFCIIAHPYESKLSRMGYYAKTPHLRAALIIALHCAESEGFEPYLQCATETLKLRYSIGGCSC